MILLLMPVACTGNENDIKVQKPDIVVSPEVLDFGQVIEETASIGALTIIDAGTGILNIDDITLAGDDEAFSIGEWPPELGYQEQYELPVTFTPPAPLTYTATLVIHSDDEDSPEKSVTLTGQGVETPTPDISCSPLSLDYGTVAVGSASTNWFTCTNNGDADLTIDDLVMSGSGAFLPAGDPAGYLLPPGQSIQLIFVYTPTTDAGDSANATLTTDDPDEPSLDLLLLGNGGGDYEYPVAALDCVTEAEPRTTVTVDGGDSEDPGGFEPLTYHWTVDGPYEDVEYIQSGSEAYIQLDLAGDYEVCLQVENTQGLLSAPTCCTISAIPDEALHVELIWSDAPDLDLHLVNSSGTLFEEPYDCNYCNVSPDWGIPLITEDNPTLDLDALEIGRAHV